MILQKIQGVKGPLPPNKHLQRITRDTLGFLESRHRFWMSNSAKTRRVNNKSKGKRTERILEFDSSNIQFLEDDNPLKEEVEVIEEKFKLKKYYNFQDMYDPEPSKDLDVSSLLDDIEGIFEKPSWHLRV